MARRPAISARPRERRSAGRSPFTSSRSWSRPTRPPSCSRATWPRSVSISRSSPTLGPISPPTPARPSRHRTCGSTGSRPISSIRRTGSARCTTASSTAPGRRRPGIRTPRSMPCCARPAASPRRPSGNRSTKRRPALSLPIAPTSGSTTPSRFAVSPTGSRASASRRWAPAAKCAGCSWNSGSLSGAGGAIVVMARLPPPPLQSGGPEGRRAETAMLAFIVRRLLLVIPSLAALLVLTFVLIRLVPADPAAALAGENATPAQIAEIRRQYGFDQPLLVQFGVYLAQVARLDFGESAYSRRPVSVDIKQRLPATLELTIAALAFATLLGIPLGTLAAVNHNRWPDTLLRILSVGGVAIAAFWFAIELQLLFAMDLGWLPLRGRLSPGLAAPPLFTGFLLIDSLIAGRLEVFGDALRHLILPAFTLSLGGLATITRFTRAGVLETLQKDFVTYERAQGFPPRALIWKFVLRNSVVAAITQIGLLFGGLIAGAVVVETIFDWPGIGFYTVQAILTADTKVILAITLLIGVIYAIVNILVDVVHGLIDPRLREDG